MTLLLPLLLLSLDPQQQQVVVDEARSVLGVPYDLGGRLQPAAGGRGAARGLDCQGLVFYALQPISTCGWRSLSVLPTTSVKGELGLPVAELAPIATNDVESKLTLLQPGDILWFLDPVENPAEPSIATLNAKPHWVWHTGLYVGAGRFVVGDHFAGAVVEEELVPYVKQHYAGLFVSRLASAPAPTKCRKHAPMKQQKN